MRGHTSQQMPMFSVIPIDSWIEERHPLRAMAALVEPILASRSADFDATYSTPGRPSIPPEQPLKSLLLQVLYPLRSEGQLLEYLRFNLLYRWFVGLTPDQRIWDETVFSKNRQRLLNGEVAAKFFAQVLEVAKLEDLVSSEHFTVDGTQIHAWASQKSFQPKNEDKRPPGDGGNPSINFHGEKRTTETHESTTDPEVLIPKTGFTRNSKAPSRNFHILATL